jgi:hypothetical protein
LLLHAIVHPANIQDRDGGILLLATLFGMTPAIKGGNSTTRSKKSCLPANADRQALGSGQGIRGAAQALDR